MYRGLEMHLRLESLYPRRPPHPLSLPLTGLHSTIKV